MGYFVIDRNLATLIKGSENQHAIVQPVTEFAHDRAVYKHWPDWQ